MLLIPAPHPPPTLLVSPDQPPLLEAGWTDPPHDPVEDPMVTTARAASLMHGFGVLVLEVWQGRRPPHQLSNTMPSHLAVAVLADSGLAASHPQVARVRASVLAESAIEGAVVISFDDRLACMTLRLERGLSTWWCSHYHLLRTPARRRSAGSRRSARRRFAPQLA